MGCHSFDTSIHKSDSTSSDPAVCTDKGVSISAQQFVCSTSVVGTGAGPLFHCLYSQQIPPAPIKPRFRSTLQNWTPVDVARLLDVGLCIGTTNVNDEKRI